MAKFQSHCSGHARGKDLIQVVSEINPKIIFPIHTEHPEVYQKNVSNVTIVKEWIQYPL
jgi:mRNA degradation ribonuclease J1/J2